MLMGLLQWGDSSNDTLKVAERFEDTLHEIFIESGGEKLLNEVQENFQRERERYREHGERANEFSFVNSENEIEAVLQKEIPFKDLTGYELFKAMFRS
jgi:hypothetical protein